jgi:hypothetical protein
MKLIVNSLTPQMEQKCLSYSSNVAGSISALTLGESKLFGHERTGNYEETARRLETDRGR